MGCDLHEACDTAPHKLWMRRLLREGFRKAAVVALFCEIRQLSATAVAGDVVSDPIARARSLRQGAPDALNMFNLILGTDLAEFSAGCEEKQWGVTVFGACRGGLSFC